MKKLLFTLAVLMFVACNQKSDTIDETSGIVISGKAVKSDGGNAIVEVFVYYDRFRTDEKDLINKYDVDESGEFEITLPEGINYAEIHIASPGYASYETKFIAGDDNPFISAELYKTAAPVSVDSASVFILTNQRNFFPMTKVDDNTLVWEGELDTNIIAYQPMFNNVNSQYDNSNETDWQYDHAGDYLNVITSDDKNFRIEIKLDEYRRYEDEGERKLTSGKWVDSPVMEQYQQIQELISLESLSRLSPSYYYFVKRGNDAVISDMSEDEIKMQAEKTLELLNSYRGIADSLVNVVESPYLSDFVRLIQHEILSVTDETTFLGTLGMIQNLNEVPHNFYDVPASLVYNPEFKNDPDNYIEILESVYAKSKDERNRNLLRYSLYYNLSRNESLKEQYKDKLVKEISSIMASDNLDSWIASGAPKLLQKLQISELEYAPDFAFTDVNGNQHQLSDFQGKWVLLDFWGTWCGPCRGETPYLVDTYEKFKNQNFEIISISTDRRVEDVTEYMKKTNMNWVNTIELPGYSEGIVDSYGVNSFPTLYLITPEGKFDRAVDEGSLRGDALMQTIEKKLTEDIL